MTDDVVERPNDRENPPPEPWNVTPRLGTYLLLIFLVVVWPIVGLLLMAVDTSQIDFDRFDPVIFIYLPTMIMQWLMFLAVALALWRENAGFASIGFTPIRRSHVTIAVGFFITANIILAGLQYLLIQMGLPISKDVDKIVAGGGRLIWWWLAVSVTAAVCEEVCFRGFILTRLRQVLGGDWRRPVLLATIAFAAGHTYQGWGGLILMLVYGAMFCGLFLYTKSLWPGIIAHFIQNFSAVLIYRWFGF